MTHAALVPVAMTHGALIPIPVAMARALVAVAAAMNRALVAIAAAVAGALTPIVLVRCALAGLLGPRRSLAALLGPRGATGILVGTRRARPSSVEAAPRSAPGHVAVLGLDARACAAAPVPVAILRGDGGLGARRRDHRRRAEQRDGEC
ncbi:hypothetical protein [Marinicauda salina]|nr:hypothetical protein [Marinicauda salina]